MRNPLTEPSSKKNLKLQKHRSLAEGKPENMVEKIAQGKLQRFFKDNTLLLQPFVKDNSKTVAQYLDSVTKALQLLNSNAYRSGN